MNRRDLLTSIGIGIFAPVFGRWHRQGSGLFIADASVRGWVSGVHRLGDGPWMVTSRAVRRAEWDRIVISRNDGDWQVQLESLADSVQPPSGSNQERQFANLMLFDGPRPTHHNFVAGIVHQPTLSGMRSS